MESSTNNHYLSMIIFGYFLLAFVTPVARGIKCYQCSSTDNMYPFQCNKYMSEDIDITPTDCDNVFGAKFCVKHVGRFEGGVGTKRFCSAVDMGNYCHYTNQPGDLDIIYDTCVSTCDSDGCNPATKKSANILVIVSLLIAPLVYLFQR